MDRYLSGENIEFDILEKDLLTAICRGSFHPVLGVAADTGAGADVLMHLIQAAFPPPAARDLPVVTTIDAGDAPQLSASADGPLVAQVIRTTSDPYVGHISVVRVFCGTLYPDGPVHVSGHLERAAGRDIEGHHDHDEDTRLSAVSAPLGNELRSKEKAIAGDICVVTKLASAQTADTISSPDQPLLVAPWKLPPALLPTAVRAHTRADEDKMPAALQELAAQDPTLRVEHNAETSQVVLWTMGPAHLDLTLSRMADRFHVNVTKEDVKVALRETFSVKTKAQGRHVKQSGGHGQYAVCQLEVEPLPRGSGIEFDEVVVGGAVPRQFIPSVEKGARAQLEKGLLAGYPGVDVKVTLTDGKAHSVDSSDMAFQTAAGVGLREAGTRDAMTLLEPVDQLTVTVDDDYVGAAMGDLNTRRGRILGTEPAAVAGRTAVTAEVPQLELLDYAIALRSFSHGTGTFTRELRGYEPMPDRLVSEHLTTE
jgi:elongation factor G